MIHDPADLIERFKERVAIMIHCGGVSEYEATKAAYFEIRNLVGRDGIPEDVIRMAKEVIKK